MRFIPLLPTLLALTAISGSSGYGYDDATGQDTTPVAPEHRGPLEVHDEHVLAQGRLTLPALSPDTVEPGSTQIRASFLWSNSFSWTQDVPGEHPTDRRFLIDGETGTVDLEATRGLSQNVDLTLRVPFRARGGGVLDGFIDAWHRTFAFLGISNGERPLFLKNAFRVEGLTTAGQAFSWNDATGFGLGDLELSGRWRFWHAPEGWSWALTGRLALPTATAPYEGSLGFGAELLARKLLGRRFDVYFGLGGTVEGQREVQGILYEPARVHGFAAVEWRPLSRVSVVLETDAASRLVANIDSYPGLDWLLNLGTKIAIRPRTLLELGFTENIKNQLCTVDFALTAGIRLTR
jgi:hypothetical protein